MSQGHLTPRGRLYGVLNGCHFLPVDVGPPLEHIAHVRPWRSADVTRFPRSTWQMPHWPGLPQLLSSHLVRPAEARRLASLAVSSWAALQALVCHPSTTWLPHGMPKRSSTYSSNSLARRLSHGQPKPPIGFRLLLHQLRFTSLLW